MPNATVILINEETSRELATTTDDEGRFHFPSPQAGSYTIKINSPGFLSYEQKQLKIKPNESLNVDLTMSVAEGTVTVGLFMSDLLIETQGGGRTVFSSDQVQKLPF